MNERKTNTKVSLPFRYAGGKYYALGKLQPFWEAVDHDEYREPFLGGGAVFWAKPKVQYNWLNDVDRELILTLELFTSKEKRSKLIEMFDSEKEATKEKYLSVKNAQPKTDLERAYKYYYLNRTSFSGKMKNPTWGYRPKRSLPPYRWKERIVPCGEKLAGVSLTTLDFHQVVLTLPQGKTVLMFLDPPYYKSKQKSHYSYPFTQHDHIRLCNILKRTPHYFFLTYDDCQEIRELYNWAYIHELSFFYRLDNSRDRENKRKVGNELVITNYPLDKNKQLSFSFVLHRENKGQKKVKKPIRKREISSIQKTRSPIRFPGSKYQAIKYIAPFLEDVPHDEYREPFLGGGAIFFAKPLAETNWLNDIDEELILTFKSMADKKKGKMLKEKVQKVKPTKKLFERLKHCKPETEIDIAFRYFVINRTAYSGIMHKPNWGYHPTKSVSPEKWPDRIEQAGLKLQKAKITNLNYGEVVLAPAEGKKVLMFIDPPYFHADQKRAYRHSFKIKDHLELADLLRETKHKFCLTYDNCEEVKDLYSWANIHEFTWRYHTANANKATRKMGAELIITNY